VLNDVQIETFLCTDRKPQLRVLELVDGALKKQNSLAFLLPDAVAPCRVSESRDSRKIALGIQWMQLSP